MQSPGVRAAHVAEMDGTSFIAQPGAAGHPVAAVAVTAALRAAGDEVPSEAVGGRLLLVGGPGVSTGFG
jgi:hypothetical protein